MRRKEIDSGTFGFFDNNGFVHYTPEANYFGAASFNSSIKAVTGQRVAANDAEGRMLA